MLRPRMPIEYDNRVSTRYTPATAERDQRTGSGERLPRERAAQPAIAEQLARAVRALDDAVGEQHEQVARAQLQRATADLDLDVAIAGRVAARRDDARFFEDARVPELDHVREVLAGIRIVQRAGLRVEHGGERGHQHVVLADHRARLIARAEDLIRGEPALVDGRERFA